MADAPILPTSFPEGRKPMATARRISLYERQIRYALSTAAIDVLFDTADVLSEGQIKDGRYFGSTMITLRLAQVGDIVREAGDLAAARRVAELVAGDARVRARAQARAQNDAESRAASRLARLDVEITARAAGADVHLDLDVEADVALAQRA